MGYGERFSGVHSARPSAQEVAVCLGCMMCDSKVAVDCDGYSGRAELVAQAEGFVPVSTGGDTGRSDCGMSALNGCKNVEEIQVMAEMIATGEVPGVSLKG